MIPGDNQRVSNSVIKVTRLIEIVRLNGGGPKDSENTLNSFLTKRDNDMF